MTTTTDATATGFAARTGSDECCSLSAGPVDTVDADAVAGWREAVNAVRQRRPA